MQTIFGKQEAFTNKAYTEYAEYLCVRNGKRSILATPPKDTHG